MKNNGQDESFSLEKYSVQELIDLKQRALKKQEELVANWAQELGSIMKEPGFDQYSRKGERRLNKFTEKHAELLADVLDIIEMVDDELSRREEYRFEKSFMGESERDDDIESMTTEEFLKYEQQKIDESRKFIDSFNDEDDE